MTVFCLVRAFLFGECGCAFHTFSRRLDEWIADWERERAAMPSMANCRKEGPLR